jgi:MFS transporter, NNP family, nitrate/nitrite transporter
MGRNHRSTDWNPDDAAAWEACNKNVARRNPLCTVAGDHAAFSMPEGVAIAHHSRV